MGLGQYVGAPVATADVIYAENNWENGSDAYSEIYRDVRGRDFPTDLVHARRDLQRALG